MYFLMNNYIKINISKKNELRCVGSFELFGIKLDKLSLKIDTGCGYTSIPLKRTPLEEEVLYNHMIEDYSNPKIKKTMTFGVNDTELKRKSDKIKFDSGDYLGLTSIACEHNIKNLTLDGYNLGDFNIMVSYKRT